MKLKKINVRKLFYNNKFVLIFSFFLAFCLWVKISSSNSETISKTISNIPITVSLSESSHQNGLTVFGIDDLTAEVSVSGNRMVLGQLTKDDIQVFAQQSAALINTTGNYTLELTAKKNGMLTDYEITSSVSPRFINVFVDNYKSKSFDISPEIAYKSDPTYFTSPVSLSEQSVTISGPDSIVSTISKVCVESEIKNTLDKTITLSGLPIYLFDENGKRVSSSMLNLSVSKVDATIAVLKRKTVKIVPIFSNKPSDLELYTSQIKISPSAVEVAGSAETLNSISKIELEALDFSKVNKECNEFDLNLKIPNGCRNLSNTYTAKLKLDMSSMSYKKISVERIEFINLAKNKSASSSTVNLNVEIVGPVSELRSVRSSDVYAQVDLSGKEEFTGSTELPVKIMIDTCKKCWAYGNYSVNVQIK